MRDVQDTPEQIATTDTAFQMTALQLLNTLPLMDNVDLAHIVTLLILQTDLVSQNTVPTEDLVTTVTVKENTTHQMVVDVPPAMLTAEHKISIQDVLLIHVHQMKSTFQMEPVLHADLVRHHTVMVEIVLTHHQELSC